MQTTIVTYESEHSILRMPSLLVPKPLEKEILVRVIGFKQQTADRSDENHTARSTAGFVAGTVVTVGKKVRNFEADDRVVCWTRRSSSEYLLVREPLAFRIDSGVSLAQVASHATVYFASYYALAHKARLRAGQSVLVHGASKPFQVAIEEVARQLGARVVATVVSTGSLRLVDQYVCAVTHQAIKSSLPPKHPHYDVVIEMQASQELKLDGVVTNNGTVLVTDGDADVTTNAGKVVNMALSDVAEAQVIEASAFIRKVLRTVA